MVYCQELPPPLRSLCRRVSSLSMQVISRGEAGERGRGEREMGERNRDGREGEGWEGGVGRGMGGRELERDER